MTDSELAHELNLLVLRTRMTFRQTIQRILKSNNVDMTFEMLQVMHCLWKEQGVSPKQTLNTTFPYQLELQSRKN